MKPAAPIPAIVIAGFDTVAADRSLRDLLLATLPIVVFVKTLVGSMVGVSDSRNWGANGAPSNANKWSLSRPWGSLNILHDWNNVV